MNKQVPCRNISLADSSKLSKDRESSTREPGSLYAF